MNTIPPPVEPPPFDKQMIEYLRAIYRQALFGMQGMEDDMPTWVPSAIRVTSPVRDKMGVYYMSVLSPGDYPCTSTLYGSIVLPADDGNVITVSLLHCEILAFKWNKKRETVLREQAEKLARELVDADPS